MRSELRSDKEDFDPMDTLDEDEDDLRTRLQDLVTEHRDLDDAIKALLRDGLLYNQLQVQRLKRKKLRLKDEITRLQSRLIPDIIA